MAEQTAIAWCDHTMNFWLNCTKVSAACDFCYAEELMDKRYHRVTWGGDRVRTSAQNWRQPYRWNAAAKRDGVRRKVFTLSLGDFMDNQVDPAWREDAWGVIDECDSLDWLILTKRPQNIPKMLPVKGGRAWPWPHVWLGTTAENQEEYDRRWGTLSKIPAARRFISYEPALGPLNIFANPLPNWIIIGGESGSRARPFMLSWARDVIEQCRDLGIAPFMKQLGEHAYDDLSYVGHSPVYPTRSKKGDDPAEWPNSLRVREFPQ
jgi:protein gp37